MTSSENQVPVAGSRESDHEREKPRDTWPSPAPSPAKSPDDTDKQDTIPTPPPELGSTDAVVIPPLRGVKVDEPS
jgi:hypothetical protein